MSISYSEDGSIVLTGDADPTRQKVIAAGTQQADQQQQISAFFASEPAPPPLAQLPFLDFMALFTQVEQAAIVSSSDTRVKIFLLMASGADSINLSDQRTVLGVDYLASTGILTTSRAAAILAGTLPAS